MYKYYEFNGPYVDNYELLYLLDDICSKDITTLSFKATSAEAKRKASVYVKDTSNAFTQAGASTKYFVKEPLHFQK